MNMKKIKVLFWEGLSFPSDTMGADLVIHSDPSNENGIVEIRIINLEIREELESIFYDEMLSALSENEFDTEQLPEDIQKSLQQYFDVSFMESFMTPQFTGGRVTTQNGKSLN